MPRAQPLSGRAGIQTHMEPTLLTTMPGCAPSWLLPTSPSLPSHASLLITYPTRACEHVHTHAHTPWLCWIPRCCRNMLAFALLKLLQKWPSLTHHQKGLSHPQSSCSNSAFSNETSKLLPGRINYSIPSTSGGPIVMSLLSM